MLVVLDGSEGRRQRLNVAFHDRDDPASEAAARHISLGKNAVFSTRITAGPSTKGILNAFMPKEKSGVQVIRINASCVSMTYDRHFSLLQISDLGGEKQVRKTETMWQEIDAAPFAEDIELAVIDDDGVHAIIFPCQRSDMGWVNAKSGNVVDVHPTHWRFWGPEMLDSVSLH